LVLVSILPLLAGFNTGKEFHYLTATVTFIIGLIVFGFAPVRELKPSRHKEQRNNNSGPYTAMGQLLEDVRELQLSGKESKSIENQKTRDSNENKSTQKEQEEKIQQRLEALIADLHKSLPFYTRNESQELSKSNGDNYRQSQFEKALSNNDTTDTTLYLVKMNILDTDQKLYKIGTTQQAVSTWFLKSPDVELVEILYEYKMKTVLALFAKIHFIREFRPTTNTERAEESTPILNNHPDRGHREFSGCTEIVKDNSINKISLLMKDLPEYIAKADPIMKEIIEIQKSTMNNIGVISKAFKPTGIQEKIKAGFGGQLLKDGEQMSDYEGDFKLVLALIQTSDNIGADNNFDAMENLANKGNPWACAYSFFSSDAFHGLAGNKAAWKRIHNEWMYLSTDVFEFKKALHEMTLSSN